MKLIPKSFEISKARVLKGYSMRGLARETGLNIGTISNIESKEKTVFPENAKKICEILDKPMEELFTFVK